MLYDIREISKEYMFNHAPVKIFEGLSFQVHRGERVAVMGPSGSGKSTLLNVIGAIDRCTKGQLIFEEKDITGLSDAGLAQLRLKKFGFIFQAYHLISALTVRENIMVPLLAQGKRDDGRVEELCRELGIEDRMDYYPYQLSGGEQQRTAIARALAGEPALILADEATGNLDSANSENIMELLSSLVQKKNIGLVYVTHDVSLKKYADNLIELKR